jgi:dTDP-4-dehydrorhamnose reductase
MTKVLVLGAQGMLGSMVARVLRERSELDVVAMARADFDVVQEPIGPLLDRGRFEWIVNAVGVIKRHIDEHAADSIEHAVAVNALFPHSLAAESAKRGQRVIQIATDGVFSGLRAPYDESAPHDATDVYGKTKSLGEVPAPHVVHLRCSIIGPERSPPSSLLGWALSSPPRAQLPGYERQRWNGVTTLHFAEICAAVIAGAQAPWIQHIVPADSVSKAELLELALLAFGRDDVVVSRQPGPEAIDRTLTTRDKRANERLWRAAGYERPPTIAAMLRELAAHEADAA